MPENAVANAGKIPGAGRPTESILAGWTNNAP
jgi:hypothetical protein